MQSYKSLFFLEAVITSETPIEEQHDIDGKLSSISIGGRLSSAAGMIAAFLLGAFRLLGPLRNGLSYGVGNPRHRASGQATRLLKFQSLKSIERLHEELILAGAVRIRLGVQEAAQFTPVHLIHQFTKLGALPLTKSRGFPAPYRKG